MSLPKKQQIFPPKGKLQNVFWYLYDASYHKVNHKQMVVEVNTRNI